MSRGGATYYYQADGLGSVTSLTDSTGTVVNNYQYDPYGARGNNGATIANPFQFTGREYDGETGLYYYRARYYDPSVDRFLSEDPIGFKAGTNFYAYARNNPTRYVDPHGTCVIDIYFESPFFLGLELPGAHAFIVITDNVGSGPTYEFRAGPGDDGALDAQVGFLNAQAPDKPADAFYKRNLVYNGCKCDPYIRNLLGTEKEINSSQITYRWASTNSNAAVTTAISNLGLKYPPLSSIPWWVRPLPGWGYTLPIKH